MDEVKNSAVKEDVEKPLNYQIKNKLICNLCGKKLSSKRGLFRNDFRVLFFFKDFFFVLGRSKINSKPQINALLFRQSRS